MRNEDKTKKHLIDELRESRRRIVELERAEAERERVERALREKEERLRSIFDIAAVGIALVDMDERFIEFNNTWCSMLGYSREKLRNLTIRDITPRDGIVIDASAIQQAAQGGKGFSRVEKQYLRKDGSRFWGDISTTILRDRDGNPEAMIGIIVDITARKQAEEELRKANEELERRVEERTAELVKANEQLGREMEKHRRAEDALRESEHKFRTLFESAPVGIGVATPDGKILAYNNATIRIMGYTAEELEQINLRDIYHGPEERTHLLKRLQTEGSVRDFEVRLKGKDGTSLYVSLAISPFTLGDENALLTVFEDITKRKRAEEALRKREAELEAQSHHLEEVNAALRVLLKQREEDKKDLEENLLCNVKKLIMPYLEKLKKSRLDADQVSCVNLLESLIDDIISPYIRKLSSKFLNLTPTEIQVAGLIKEGKTTKEIAELLHLSENTIVFHRYNLRTKLGLKNKKINLRSYLQIL